MVDSDDLSDEDVQPLRDGMMGKNNKLDATN